MTSPTSAARRLCRYRRPALATRLQRGAQVAGRKPLSSSFEDLGERVADALAQLRDLTAR